MRSVSFVKSNLKDGVDVELGPRTLIVGPRASGKSAIVNAVELALTGRVSDVAGRDDIGREIDLLALAPPGEGLFAEVQIEEGETQSTARFECKRTKTGASRAVHTHPLSADPARIFPLREVLDPLTGSPESMRKFLLSRVASGVGQADVEALIPTSLLDHYRRALQSCSPTLNVVDRVVVVLELAKSKAREATARAKAAHGVALSAAQGLAGKPTVVQVAAAAKRLEEAKAALEEAIAAASSLKGAQSARANLAGARAQIESLEQARVNAHTRLDAVRVALEGIVAEARALPAPPAPNPALEAITAAMIVAGEGAPDCPVCGLVPPAGVIHARLATVRAVTKAAEDLRRQHAVLEARWQTAKQARQHAEGAVAQVEAQLAMVRQLAANLEQVSGGADAMSAHDAEQAVGARRAQVVDAESEATALATTTASWRASEGAHETELAAEWEGTSWSHLVDACNDAVKKLLDANVAAFVERVQARLPAAWKFGIQLHDGAREVARIGLERDGRLLTALSGGEWATVTAAIADACVTGDDLTIIVPEDRGVDPAGLLENLKAFSNCRSQVIVTSTVAPVELPAGWTVINVGSADARVLAGLERVMQANQEVIHGA